MWHGSPSTLQWQQQPALHLSLGRALRTLSITAQQPSALPPSVRLRTPATASRHSTVHQEHPCSRRSSGQPAINPCMVRQVLLHHDQGLGSNPTNTRDRLLRHMLSRAVSSITKGRSRRQAALAAISSNMARRRHKPSSVRLSHHHHSLWRSFSNARSMPLHINPASTARPHLSSQLVSSPSYSRNAHHSTRHLSNQILDEVHQSITPSHPRQPMSTAIPAHLRPWRRESRAGHHNRSHRILHPLSYRPRMDTGKSPCYPHCPQIMRIHTHIRRSGT